MATRTWDGGGTGELASTAENWSDDTAPIAGDIVVFDATSSKNCTFDLTAAFASINTTGYTGLVTASATMTVTGNVTFATSTFAHGSQLFTFTGTADFTITSNGNAFHAVTFNTGAPYPTITLGDDMTVNGTLTNSNYIKSFAGAYTIHAKGDVTCSGANSLSYNADSAASFAIDGSGNQAVNFTMADATYPHRINVDVNSSGGTVTFANATHYFAKNLSKTAGTVDFTTNTSTVMLKGQTGNASLMSATLYNLTFSTFVGSLYTTTLQGDVTVNNTTTLTSGTGFPTLNGYALHMKGDLVGSTGSSFYAGTTDLYVSGTGTQAIDFRTDPSFPTANKVYITNSGIVNLNSGTNYFKNDLIFNGTGTYNLAGTINYKTGTITYTAGTVSAGTSVLSITGAATLNTNGMSWYDITMGANITLTSNLSLTHNWIRTAGTISGDYSVVFNGLAPQSIVGNTSFNGLTFLATRTINLASSGSFVVTGSFNAVGSQNNLVVLSATTSGQRGLLTVGSSQNVTWVLATDIDSSKGVLVVNSLGTLSNTVNWSTGGVVVAVGSARLIYFEFWEG